MEWDKLIQKLLKNLDNLIPFLVFAAMILGPIIKAIVQKKKQQQAGGGARPQPEQEEATSWWEEEQPEAGPEPMAKTLPPPQPPPEPVRPLRPVETPQPAPVAAMQEVEVPIERASEDVVEEAARVAYGAESVSALSREEKITPATAGPREGWSAGSEVAPTPSGKSPFDRLSPLEAAIVFGSSLDRPVAFAEPSWARF